MATQSQDSWDAVAETYNAVAGTEIDIAYSTLKADLWGALGELDGKRVLDLGCGSGWLSWLMAERGAEVTGIDGSGELLAMARERYPDGTWMQHDLSRGIPSIDAFDTVVSNMVLMDFDPIEPLVSQLSEALDLGARVIVTMPHPAFFNYESAADEDGGYRKVRRYLEQEEWTIPTFGGHAHYHRPISFYINAFGDHGFLLKHLREPESKAGIPVFCLMEFVRVAF